MPTLVLILLASNFLIGLLLTVVQFGSSLWQNVAYSEFIGLSIFALVYLVFHFAARGSVLRWALVPVAILLGGTIGQVLGNLILHAHLGILPAFYSKSQFIALFFGSLGAIAMYVKERYWVLEAELRSRELQRLEAEKRSIEAHLKMLQAQIEPHFLFNSLANVAGLIEPDPALARHLLEDLIRYLRASLKRTRAEGGTLGDELDLLEAYLDIFKIRLGPRLNYSFSVPDQLRAVGFPPMLLQPLVENAIRHGIEPRITGGRVDIAAVRLDGALELTVRDTGAGFADALGQGLGLENVRARLAALFGDAGSLAIAELAEGGVLATLRLPA
jgi:LytS/YehU family sensor histidine kinase